MIFIVWRVSFRFYIQYFIAIYVLDELGKADTEESQQHVHWAQPASGQDSKSTELALLAAGSLLTHRVLELD